LFWKQNVPFCANAKPAVTQMFNHLGVAPFDPLILTLVQHDKVISSTLIFPEFHATKLGWEKFISPPNRKMNFGIRWSNDFL